MQNSFIIIGLGFGDEGKGTITDYLVHKYKIKTVIRFNGGSQAAHNVVTPEGLWHTFSQFGSGTFYKENQTFLSSQMLLDPYALLEEESVLKRKGITNAMNRLILDPNSPVITPFHKMLGRVTEIERGKERLGTTGKGIGQVVQDISKNNKNTIYIKDFYSKKNLRLKLELHYQEKLEKAENTISLNGFTESKKVLKYFKDKYNPTKLFNFYNGFANTYSNCIDKKEKTIPNLFKSNSSVLFEGAQGALLDKDLGFFPYITKTDTKLSAAENLYLPFKDTIPVNKIGVLRAYSHRHGNGPLPTEMQTLSKKIPEEHNVYNEWQGDFRVGWLDLILCRYAIAMNPNLDSIALTCLDKLSGFSKIKICTSYKFTGVIEKNLSSVFNFEKIRNEYRITSINPVFGLEMEDRKKVTEILSQCKPFDFLEFKGWKENLNEIKFANQLPKNVKTYLEFLKSKQGLALPISILSFGNTRENKFP